MRALKGLALPRASYSGEIALAGSRGLHSTLVAAPVLFAHAAVTEAKNQVVLGSYDHGACVPHLRLRQTFSRMSR